MSTATLSVALDIPLNRFFDYLQGDHNVTVGQRVRVPFGNKQRIGIVMQVQTESDYDPAKLKPILQVFDQEPALDHQFMHLLHFSAQYYQYPVGQAVLAALPSRLKQIKPSTPRLPKIYQLTSLGIDTPLESIPKRQLIKRKLFEALSTTAFLTDSAVKQVSSSAPKSMKTLIEEGMVKQSVSLTPDLCKLEASKPPALNDEQQNAISSITKEIKYFSPWLIYGVTGSGKTEVYMQLMAHFFSANADSDTCQMLVLVPEINLTPQLENRFRQRFTDKSLVSLHSHLNDSERLHNWQQAQSGAAQIIIGTRLSVFTPLPNLKLIIIDEEHDGSYKQQDSMRYHARDVAMIRAKQLDIPIVLGSATPSLESWFNVKQEKYQLLRLSQRAVSQAQLPDIQCIDTSTLNLNNGFSPQLIQALKSRIARGEQSLLFINRRGYSPVLLCHSCQWIADCKRCSSRLVVHQHQNRLRCHHCGYEQFIPQNCPSCGSPDCHPTGHGTQRIEETLNKMLPDAKVARVDRDSISRKDALIQLLDAVQNNEIDILIGTQMLAKGHDFPNLTLVGVLDTDSALYSPDFRASERLFAQLMQVSGRAGRADKKGEVLIQTQFPFHPLFNALRKQDFTSFANSIMEERELMQFPPYCFSAVLRAEANNYKPVQAVLEFAYAQAQSMQLPVTVYAPVRPQMERLKGMERAHIIFQSNNRTALQQMLKALFTIFSDHTLAKKVRWSIDVDPLEF